MKNLFTTKINLKSLDFILLLVRIAVAAFMLTHGFPKLIKLLAGGEIRFADPFGFGMTFSLVLAVFAEFICSILIGLGIGTRLATIPLIITMSVAAFVAHGADPFGKKELALLYLVIYLFLLFAGSGKFSIDYLISRKSK
ncbi:DoxX family protein [Draconibacterium sp.]